MWGSLPHENIDSGLIIAREFEYHDCVGGVMAAKPKEVIERCCYRLNSGSRPMR
jgi:hypothetical protein